MEEDDDGQVQQQRAPAAPAVDEAEQEEGEQPEEGAAFVPPPGAIVTAVLPGSVQLVSTAMAGQGRRPGPAGSGEPAKAPEVLLHRLSPVENSTGAEHTLR